MENYDLQMRIPVRGEYDVIVAGGGVAWAAAALSAVRCGKKVLLAEKSTMLGGLATMGLINYFEPLCNGRGKKIISGMAEEFLLESVKYGWDTIPPQWKDGQSKETGARYVTHYSPYIFALQLTEMLHDAGVDLLFDCNAVHPVMEGKHCTGVVTDSKSGLEMYPAKMVVDTTGDADLLRRSGMPTVTGRNFFTYIGRQVTLDGCRKALETGEARQAVTSISGGGASLYGNGQPDDVPLYAGTTVEDVSDYLIRNQTLMLQKLKGQDRLARELTTLPAMAQFRTTCRIDGDYTLKEEDKYTHFADSIAAICDFDRRNYLYEVPYRTLTRAGYDNLITAGRSASAMGYAWDILRVIPPAILTGQAAGIAASQAIDERKAVWDIDSPRLQNTLETRNVMIHFDNNDIVKED